MITANEIGATGLFHIFPNIMHFHSKSMHLSFQRLIAHCIHTSCTFSSIINRSGVLKCIFFFFDESNISCCHTSDERLSFRRTWAAKRKKLQCSSNCDTYVPMDSLSLASDLRGTTNGWAVPLMKIHTMFVLCFSFPSNVFSLAYSTFYTRPDENCIRVYGFDADFMYAMKAYGAFRSVRSFMVLCTFSIKS